jgi:hypothetical protein
MCSDTGERARDGGTNTTARTRDHADLSVQVQQVGGRRSGTIFKFLSHVVVLPKISHAILLAEIRIAIERPQRLWNNGQRSHRAGHNVHHGQ